MLNKNPGNYPAEDLTDEQITKLTDGTYAQKGPILTSTKDHGTIMQYTKEVRSALWTLSADMHQVSTRSCATCKALTDALGKPFGCYALQDSIKKAREKQERKPV